MNYQFFILLFTQFIVGISDNALILVVIALLQEQTYPAWWVPILKAVFTVSFVLFAPVVGHVADIRPKRRVMQGATVLKIGACTLLLLGAHPFLCLLLAGLGAAIYSPAKYGLATEMVELNHLVKANAWLEVSTVLASIFGFLLGGLLVSESLRQSKWAQWFSVVLEDSGSLYLSILTLILMLTLASVLTRFLPETGFKKIQQTDHFSEHLKEFLRSLRLFWSDPLGRISLCVTTLFWGIGSTMQLLVLVWAQERLGFTLSQASYFQVTGALGMVVGAMLAAAFIKVKDAIKLTKLGFMIGLMMMAMSLVQGVWSASFLMVVIGLVCALLIVPFNALLQHRGKKIVFTGQSIAVQNFCENSSVLLISLFYSVLLAFGVSLNFLMLLFGLLILVAIFLIIYFCRNLKT